MQDPIQTVYDGLTADGIEQARNHTSPPRRFRASEAGNCVRATYHRLSGARPKPREAGNFIYGILGDVDHDATRQIMNHHGVKIGGVTIDADGVATEHLLKRETFKVANPKDDGHVNVELTSRADGTLQTKYGDTLLEIKGTGFYPYQWLNKAFIEGGHDGALARVKEKHKKWYMQCQITMALTGYKWCYLLVKDRATGTLGQYNPETGERSGIYIEFDVEVFENLLQRFAYVTRKLDERVPPMPEYTASTNDCGWCDFRYLCHDAQERQDKGLTPTIVYPGPQFETHKVAIHE